MDTPKVSIVRQTTIQQANGALKAGYAVTFMVGAQGPFTIQVPAEQFTSAEVIKQMEAFAQQLAQLPMQGA